MVQQLSLFVLESRNRVQPAPEDAQDYDYSNRRDETSRPQPKSTEFRLNLPLNETLDDAGEVKLFWVYDSTHIILKVNIILNKFKI